MTSIVQRIDIMSRVIVVLLSIYSLVFLFMFIPEPLSKTVKRDIYSKTDCIRDHLPYPVLVIECEPIKHEITEENNY